MKTQDITYRDGDLSCNGFLAYDETIRDKRPGVLVVHEAWGLGEHAKERAKMLAGLGYVAFAADMFGGRKQISDMKEAMAVIGDLLGNPPKIRARAQAALSTLASQPQVDAKRLGGIGFCFGGSTVLELAREGTDLAGVVSFHGGLETKGPAVSGAVKAKVLVCTGADDPLIPPPQVVAFEEEMRKAGADWQVISYGKTVHSFTNPSANGAVSPALLYNKSTDKRSWAAMTSFFEEAFAR
ncbi:MAG: dienelactone hydrolase family protein [Rhodospirillaceae bacterium]|nr:MAG: dienelactone hydrolase family protein [Rhodospirillaceae bacterium]